MSRAYAFSSSANLGPGFDILAVAHNAYFDEVEVLYIDRGSRRVEVLFVGPYAEGIDSHRNTVVVAVREYLDRYGIDIDVVLRVWKGIPISAGLGGSAASAVAALVALSRALNRYIDPMEIVELAGRAEIASAGSPHYDNAAASALGHLVLLLSIDPVKVYRLRIEGMRFVVATPKIGKTIERKTALMRSVLPREIGLSIHVRDSSRLAALILGIVRRDREILKLGFGKSFVDEARSRYIPCYYEVAEMLFKLGYSISISGAGPSITTFCFDYEECLRVAQAIEDVYRRECDIDVCVKVAEPAPGAIEVSDIYGSRR